MAQDGEQPAANGKAGLSLSFGGVKAKKAKIAVSEQEAAAKRELITGFGKRGVVTADGEPAAAVGPLFIPKQENSFKAGVGKTAVAQSKPSRFIPDRDDGGVGGTVEDKFEAAAESAPDTSIVYGLNIQRSKFKVADAADAAAAAAEPSGERQHDGGSGSEAARANGAAEPPPQLQRGRGGDWESRAFKEDVSALPDAADAAAYEAMPVEEFGAAMLRGMGWSDGQGIGKRSKGPVAPYAYVQRPHRLGLGAQPAAPEEKPKRHIKPGDSREAKQQQVYIDAEGRQRHVVTLDDKLVDRQLLGVHPGKTMHLLSGRHAGLTCEVLALEPKVEGRSDKATVRLNPSSQTVSVRCKELGEKFETDALAKGKDSGDEAKRKSSSKEAKRQREDDSGAGRNSQPQKQRRQEGDGWSAREPAAGAAVSSEPGWLVPHIRVRIVDKQLSKGRLYLKKATVVDVHKPTVCDVVVNDPRQRVTGVGQHQLETIVPKTEGSRVLLLRGEHKGQRARLLQKGAEAAAVQLLSEYGIVKIGLDDLAEYVGDAHEEE